MNHSCRCGEPLQPHRDTPYLFSKRCPKCRAVYTQRKRVKNALFPARYGTKLVPVPSDAVTLEQAQGMLLTFLRRVSR